MRDDDLLKLAKLVADLSLLCAESVVPWRGKMILSLREQVVALVNEMEIKNGGDGQHQ